MTTQVHEGGAQASDQDLRWLRVDQVGSLLRPAALRDAFVARAEDGSDDEGLRALQDDAITSVVARQEEIGLPVISDGEFRRRVFSASFSQVEGFEEWASGWRRLRSATRDGEPTTPALSRVPTRPRRPTKRLRLVHNDLLDEFTFAQGLTKRPVKVALIGADRIANGYGTPRPDDVYATVPEFLEAIVDVQTQMIGELREAGCRYVTIDEPSLTAYVDERSLAELRELGEDPQESLARAIAADNAVIGRSPGVTFGVHLCRGNRRSLWHREGAYDGIAEQLFSELAFDRFLLEYDSPRAGTFTPLRFVPKGKVVVLGLITTKTGDLEDADQLVRRIEEAAKHVPVEQLAISPQCGFASVVEGNRLRQEEQWRKLELMLEVADRVWCRR